jgi:hypothetical protein
LICDFVASLFRRAGESTLKRQEESADQAALQNSLSPMLDVQNTRRKFLEWVRSPEFDAHFDATAKRAVWPFVVGGILILSIAGAIPGLALIVYGFKRESARKAARRDAHLTFSEHEVILCAVVIGNKELIAGRAPVAPALLMGTFGPQDEQALRDVTSAAALIGGVYGQDPANVPPELQEVCRLVNDDTFHPDRRRLVPAHLFPNRQLWLFDTILLGSHFDSGTFDSGWIPCLAQPGTHGTIAQLPSGPAVFKERETSCPKTGT